VHRYGAHRIVDLQDSQGLGGEQHEKTRRGADHDRGRRDAATRRIPA